jgi:hypothetical protein
MRTSYPIFSIVVFRKTTSAEQTISVMYAVRVDGRIVGGEEWQEKVYNREEWKKLLRWATNRRMVHMPVE